MCSKPTEIEQALERITKQLDDTRALLARIEERNSRRFNGLVTRATILHEEVLEALAGEGTRHV